jgi:hypothetical protein
MIAKQSVDTYLHVILLWPLVNLRKDLEIDHALDRRSRLAKKIYRNKKRKDSGMERNVVWHKYVWVFFLSIFLVGCAGAPMGQAPTSQASSTTDMLTQAGFQAETVKDPEHLQKLPGNQFVTVQRQGRTVYVYTNPNTKQLYFGSETAYQRYLSMAAAKAAEAPKPQVSSQSSMSMYDWDMYAHLHGVGP